MCECCFLTLTTKKTQALPKAGFIGNESFDIIKAVHDNINNYIDGKTVDAENLVKSENAEETLPDEVYRNFIKAWDTKK